MKTLVFRFIVAAGLIGMGCYALIAGWPGAGFYFCFLQVVIMSRADMNRSVPGREVWLMLLAIIGLVLLLVGCRWLIPSAMALKIEQVLRHPVLVVPFGLLLYWGLYRAYQRQRKEMS